MMALVNANRQRRQAEEQTAQAATAKDRGHQTKIKETP
jgi:hypothetical protein